MRNKVLIIDDAEFNREMLTEILQEEYPILPAQDGQQGIEMLETYASEICIVLLFVNKHLTFTVQGYSIKKKSKEEY